MTVLFPNLCHDEVYYKGFALYTHCEQELYCGGVSMG